MTYGIQNERSDLRAHVCPVVRRVYVFPTEEGQRIIKTGKWRRTAGYQKGVDGPTAMGYLVPPFAICRCIALEVRDVAWDAVRFSDEDDTTTKGHKAVLLVENMIRAGLFPLPYVIHECETELAKAVQIDGDDIVVLTGANRVHIQVKCDYPGGDKTLGGTGNLFLQVQERNPLKKV